MFFGRTDQKNTGLLPTSPINQAPPNPLWAEVARLLWFTAAVVLLLALASYSPTDPSWSTWSSRASYRNWIGRTGSVLSDVLFQLWGVGAFAIALVLAAHAFTRHRFIRETDDHKLSFLTPLCFLLSVSTLLQIAIPDTWIPWHLANAGGLVGKIVAQTFRYAAGDIGATIISVVTTLVATIFVFRLKVVTYAAEAMQKLKAYFSEAWPRWKAAPVNFVSAQLEKFRQRRLVKVPATPAPTATKNLPPPPAPEREEEPEYPAAETKPSQMEIPELLPGEIPISVEGTDEEIRAVTQTKMLAKEKKNKVVRKPHQPFQLPPVTMISGRAESKVKAVDKNWFLEKANILVQKLKDFGVEGEVVHISPGPVITVYEFKPASGVKIKEIANLSDDLTLALSVLSVRIVAPIPGKPVVGIEIPSPNRETVFFKDMINETPFYKDEIRIPIALGRLASGEAVTADLAAMPHLLVAGATGTGKSVFINTLIASLVFRFTPEKLKLVLVDPKMVELSMYEGIAHLLLPVVVDSKKAAMALRWTVDEMERRYTLMHKFGVRHLDQYNSRLAEYHAKGQGQEFSPMPYIVVVVDEYADLMAVVPKDVELSIARLAQKARASGIHLVLATQRPSTDVVTGTIKANFPSRISFRVASAVDSKTILDRTGAERLLGQGDMLFHSAGFTSLKRMQGAFMSDSDLQGVVDHLKAQGEPEYDERILKSLEDQAANESGEGGSASGESSDEENRLYDQAVRLVTEKGEASISFVQRHLRIGYNRAAILIERMEKEGVIAPSTGTSKRRQVIAPSI